MHETNEINTTNGGSSGNCSGNLPHNQLEIFASLSALDYNWLSLPPDNLLKAMQDSLNGLKALSMNLSADTLRLVFDENSISSYENDSQLFYDVMLWLECALNNRVGRAQIRMNILNHFNHCFSSPIAEPMLADVNEQAPAPVGSAHQKIVPLKELPSLTEREKFWIQEESKEKERIAAEKHRKVSERKTIEEERKRREKGGKAGSEEVGETRREQSSW